MNRFIDARCCTAALLISLSCCSAAIAQSTATPSPASSPSNTPGGSSHKSTDLLSAAELQKLIPATVFFRGQTSTVQYRNSGGIRFTGGPILFAVKVDTGGYSSSIQERYQDYLVSEVAIQFVSHTLPSGAYGVGFVGPNFLVMDLGGHTLLTIPSTTDTALHRPRPLDIVAAPASGAFRLYSGKQYVDFKPAQ